MIETLCIDNSLVSCSYLSHIGAEVSKHIGTDGAEVIGAVGAEVSGVWTLRHQCRYVLRAVRHRCRSVLGRNCLGSEVSVPL